jgi:hypothetical protein
VSEVQLDERQTNLVATAMSMLAAAAQPTRRVRGDSRQHTYDDHVIEWFNRCMVGTRTPAAATHGELVELWQVLNHARSIVVEEASDGR